MYKYLFLVFIIVFTGCVQKQEYVDKKVYKGYSKDAVLEATKKVFYLADEQRQFQVNSFRNKVEVTKPKFYHNFLDVGIYEDTWIIEVVQEKDQTRVKLDLKRVEILDEKKKVLIHKDLNTDIFWQRVEFLLGLNNKWASCKQSGSFFTNDGVICDMGVLDEKEASIKDIVKNPLIEQRPTRVYSVDTIDADVYKFTDLSIKKNKEDIFKPEEKATQENTLNTNNELPNKEEIKANEDLLKLKEEMNKLLEQNEDIDNIKIEQIIQKEDVKEDSEFILETQDESSEDKLNKLDELDNN